MKTTKRIISSSALTSAAYQQILADKKALRERCAQATPAVGPLQHAI